MDNKEKDSGMSSLSGSKTASPEPKTSKPGTPEPRTSKPGTPEPSRPATADSKKTAQVGAVTPDSDVYDDEPDESIFERLWGLTEMFPSPVRQVCGKMTDISAFTVKTLYQFSCNASWIFFTSSMILFAPVIFETERAQMEEMQRTQQKQVLLGPGSAGNLQSGNSGIPALPPMQAR